MPNVKNQETLAVIKEELSNAGAVWVVDYCGLTVKEVQELRRSVREAGVQEHPRAHRPRGCRAAYARRHAQRPERIRVRW